MAPEVLAGARPEIVLLPLLPAVPLTLKLTVEPLGLLFALVASVDKGGLRQ